MPLNDAAQGLAEKFPQLAIATGSAPVIPKINADGALTGDSEDLGMMTAPDPVGHFMLVALPEVEARTASGIYIPETVTDRERAASVVGTVIEMGPDCYRDPEPKIPQELVILAANGVPVNITILTSPPRFPSGPWCKIGDTVLFSRYAGKRFKIEGVEFRMLADDEITATIPIGAKVGGL